MQNHKLAKDIKEGDHIRLTESGEFMRVKAVLRSNVLREVAVWYKGEENCRKLRSDEYVQVAS